MHNAERFAYAITNNAIGETGLVPELPITLTYQGHSVNALGLLDTGSAVNVMPYHIGVALGAIWEQMTIPVQLSGNLAHLEARGLAVLASVSRFNPVRLAFAWTRADDIPLILGQVNFFLEFDVCFYRSQQAFEVHPKTGLAIIQH